MEDNTIAIILAKNPHIDKDDLKKAHDMIERVRLNGGKSTFIAALPPTDPYSTMGRAHTLSSPRARGRLRK